MKKFLALLFVLTCCLLPSQLLVAQANPPATQPAAAGGYFQALVREAKSRIREVGVDQLAALLAASPAPVVIDVREDNEWTRSRIPGAIHVGRGVLEMRIESRIPQKETPIIVYCQGGSRSALAADTLAKMGYTNVSSLAGGFGAYQAAGLPLDQSAPAE